MYLINVTSKNVDEGLKIYFNEPKLSWINPNLCVDMDCDGPKHSIAIDRSGTFLGRNGTVIPKSELRFDPERIPAIMRTDNEGNVLGLDELFEEPGIFRDHCVFNPSWNAYNCPRTSYSMLVIENMDAGSLSRRVSPIGILSLTSSRYLDLLNGPKNLGWCAHYSCLERLSTFFAIISEDESYQISFTGSNPQELRLFNLNAGQSNTATLIIDWPTSQRLDVYVSGELVDPTDNGIIRGGENDEGRFIPSDTMKSGSNYYSIRNSQLTVICKGDSPIHIMSSPVITATMGLRFDSAEDFFDSSQNGQLIINLAAFLDIDPIRIKIVSVIPENSLSKRNGFGGVFTFEVGDPPKATNQQPDVSEDENGTGAEDALVKKFETEVENYNKVLDEIDELTDVASSLISRVQLGGFLDGVSVLSVVMKLPQAPAPPEMSSLLTGNTTVNTTQVRAHSGYGINIGSGAAGGGIDFQIPNSLHIDFSERDVPVKLPTFSCTIMDADGEAVKNLGLGSSSWILSVTLLFEDGETAEALLEGTKIRPFIQGTVIFDDLIIKQADTTYADKTYKLQMTPISNDIVISKFQGTTSPFIVQSDSQEPHQETTANSNVLVIISSSAGAVLLIAGVSAFIFIQRRRRASRKGRISPNAPIEHTPAEPMITVNDLQNTEEEYDISTYFEVIERYSADSMFPDELGLEIGDIIQVTSKSADMEWFVGYSMNKNKAGRFPSKCVLQLKSGDPISKLALLYRTQQRPNRLPPSSLPESYRSPIQENETNQPTESAVSLDRLSIPEARYQRSSTVSPNDFDEDYSV